jgi:hypothetical protein
MFSLLSFLNVSSLFTKPLLDETDFTYRIANISHNSETNEGVLEDTFINSVNNPVENYDTTKKEPVVEELKEIKPFVEELKEKAPDAEETIVEEQNECVCCKQCKKNIILEQEENSETEEENSETEEEEMSEPEPEPEEEDIIYDEKEKFLYCIVKDKKVMGYIDDYCHLLDYLNIIKNRIYKNYNDPYNYWMKYYWNETVNFNRHNDLVVKYSLVSVNTHNLLAYDRLETVLQVYKMSNLLIK